MTQHSICTRTSRHEVRLEAESLPLGAVLTSEVLGEGLDVVRLRLHADTPTAPSPLRLEVRLPAVDVFGRWHPAVLHARHLPPEWAPGFVSELTRNAPVLCVYNVEGLNKLTLACSDLLNPIEIRAGVHEETAEILCRLDLFGHAHPPLRDYQLQLLIDTRCVPYHRALDDVQQWWRARGQDELPRSGPAGASGTIHPDPFALLPVPPIARAPMYSTWYSFHQNLEPRAVLNQCRIARELGCEAVIVDDGWQTADSRRGYAYAGDWEPERIGDMAGFVNDVHALGMRFLLWYALPFVGTHSRARKRFDGQLLKELDYLQAGVLDPRYPEIREHLVETLARAMREWKLDGFKLDFLDEFSLRSIKTLQHRPGMDHLSVAEAAQRLMQDITDRLRAIRPDVAIEYRQEYIGPLMRQFGNMFRAGDCPNDALTNRVRTIDIRLLCGETACHADMFMWHPGDPVERAALQLLNTLFAVPQVSVLLDQLPAEHLEMLRFWLRFWRDNREVLLDGELQPLHPHALYPVVIASKADRRIVACYEPMAVNPGPSVPSELVLVNATAKPRIVLDLAEDMGRRRVDVDDCRGRRRAGYEKRLAAGLHAIAVPAGGVARVTAI